jgi:hypothetical protein
MATHMHDRRGFCIACRSAASEDEFCQKATDNEAEGAKIDAQNKQAAYALRAPMTERQVKLVLWYGQDYLDGRRALSAK